MLAFVPLTALAPPVRLIEPRPGSLYELLSAQAQRDAGAAAILALGRTPLDFGALLDQIDYDPNDAQWLRSWARRSHRAPRRARARNGRGAARHCMLRRLRAAELRRSGAELEHGLVQTGAKALLVPTTASAEVEGFGSPAGHRCCWNIPSRKAHRRAGFTFRWPRGSRRAGRSRDGRRYRFRLAHVRHDVSRQDRPDQPSQRRRSTRKSRRLFDVEPGRSLLEPDAALLSSRAQFRPDAAARQPAAR